MTWPAWGAKAYFIAASWLAAAILLLRLWRSAESTLIKIGLTLIAPIPVLGPVLILWISNFPRAAPAVFQDRSRYGSDVYERWSDVFKERNPHLKFRKWRALISGDKDFDA